MSQINYDELSFDDEDELKYPRPTEQDFDRIVESAISRRGFLSGVLAFGSGAAVMGVGPFSGTAAQAQQTSRFAFEALAPQTDGTVHVPPGYKWDVLVRWGDPLFSDAPEFSAETGVPTEGSDRVFGENTDGMELFLVGDTELLVVNSEYVNPKINLPAAQEGSAASAEDIVRLQNFQGVSVMEVAEGDTGWEVVVDSPYNRRIHHRTPMLIEGPAAGHDLLKTAADATGTESLGTFNNCGSGRTPWGTYLTCEENFNGYFGTTAELTLDEVHAKGFGRYGISMDVDPGRYNYHGFDERFDLSKNPNEPHRAGYIVEIDPADPTSTPIKRTALGR
ncbi:MAG: alkaline phosphatase PhoX, partial [Pseudomonadota bacterium]